MKQEVTVYDFKKPQRYSTGNMRFLSVIAEEFCKSINLFVTYELKRPNIVCKLDRIEQTNYEEFMNMISNDSVIVEHAIQPLVKGLIYQLDKSVALTFIDLILGGDGEFGDTKRELTAVDRELISYVGSKFLTKMYIFEGCEYREVSHIYTNVGSSKKYPISESVVISHMKMMDGDKEVGRMSFCNPYSCMEPVLEQLEPKRLFKSKSIEYDFEFTNAIYNKICGTSTDMVAILGRTKVSVEELLDLKVGDVITLDTKVDGDMDLHVGGSSAFKCKLGLIKNKKGVMITDCVKKEG
ncbi:flagellar motor switch protein FliM [Paraclostridium sordellii]|uniref:flagellar motor switch protein FliM n=1 Tax=Paraclostridium sordellii TaxID=1505 RepID=UPI0005DFADED|nr:FliM/FliN family flagellar motor switch protein [Paeniclostridium sordellii]CEN21893.1 flagellar motor switch protein FliM [[Clostridium] sordellii] [Paeniclostridium sordellii]CEP50859.1 flagellar motor switch protein FliM [[Clostridium] sordellii] [Paeniclostridium sordellii]